MTFLGNQRPAAPWSNHNFWGQFDTAANLPNTATSDIQVAASELQRGDIAWADGPGAGSLYMCLNPAVGGAQWTPISYVTPPSFGAVELWVDGDNGSDSNPGTQALPLQTVDAALDAVPTYLDRDYIVHILEAPIQGAYQAPSLEREFFCGAFRLALVGEAYTVIDSGTLTGFTNTTGNPWLLEDNTQAWSTDEHIVRFLRLTSGAAAGSLLNVIENDATTIRTAGAFVNAAIGDSYEIVRPAVRLEGFNGIGGSEKINGFSFFTTSGSFSVDSGGLTLANLELASALVGLGIGGFTQVYGCVLSAGLTINEMRAGTPLSLSFLNTSLLTQGSGAGLIADLGTILRAQGSFSGVLNAESLTSFTGGSADAHDLTLEIIAGRLWNSNSSGCINVRYNRVARLGVVSTSADNVGRLLLKPGLGGTINFGLRIELGALGSLEDSCVIDCTDAGSVGILARGARSTALLEGGTVDAQARGLRAEGGGEIQISGNGASLTTAGSNVGAVEAVGAAAADTGGAGAFTTDLNFVTAPDGSTVRRVDS